MFFEFRSDYSRILSFYLRASYAFLQFEASFWSCPWYASNYICLAYNPFIFIRVISWSACSCRVYLTALACSFCILSSWAVYSKHLSLNCWRNDSRDVIYPCITSTLCSASASSLSWRATFCRREANSMISSALIGGFRVISFSFLYCWSCCS